MYGNQFFFTKYNQFYKIINNGLVSVVYNPSLNTGDKLGIAHSFINTLKVCNGYIKIKDKYLMFDQI